MSNYAIMRTEKLNTIQKVAGSGSHVFRLKETANADQDRKKDNKILVDFNHSLEISDKNLLHKAVNNRIESGLNEKAKVRKDSVRAIHFVLTASPDFFENASKEQFKKWQEANTDWLKEKYGEANLVSAVLHLDETTPHIHAHVVPITDDGRLSAKDLIGGTRDKHRKLQTDYAETMKQFGLKRGSEKSIAKHQDIKEYYQNINDAKSKKMKIPKIDKPPVFNREEYQKRMKKRVEKLAKSAKHWKYECKRLSQNSNHKAVEEAEKKRRVAEEQQKNLSDKCNKLLDQKSKIDDEYNRYKEKTEKELSAKNEANQRLIEKNKRLRKKLEKKNVKTLSMK